MRDKNTTRRKKTGGLGLKLIREFIHFNKGKIIVVSDAGYWSLNKGEIEKNEFSFSFPGTVVLIEINTDDDSYYSLKSEKNIDPDSIF